MSSPERGSCCLLWFRRDLRLTDNPALLAACRRYERVVPVYIDSSEEEGDSAPGAASRWWLHHALSALDESLRARASGLLVLRGPARQTLLDLCRDVAATAVYWNRLYDPDIVARDRHVQSRLAAAGVEVASFNASLLHEPGVIATGKGEPYRLFTPFWKACRAATAPALPEAAPDMLPAFVAGTHVDVLDLLPHRGWDAGFAQRWRPGEAGALRALSDFLACGLADYSVLRDYPVRSGTSRLSPYLHFGEIGPRQVLQACRAAPGGSGAEAFERQLYWREFAHHLLVHFPHTAREALDARFAAFPWRDDDGDLAAWQCGATGIPIVDAGMRELWQSGWMHNRVRMLVASVLTKSLLLPWQAGADWFRETLLDADLACNTLGWQWTAGCGADAAPYFRVFNPVLQGERFDADGDYVRQWLPELAALPAAYLHRPWEAPAAVLDEAGIVLGRDYPLPRVDLKFGRERALAAWVRFRAC
ncbi:cryptochrome/photolyase family protein [Paludibacterium yongneupense]|uniref:cryptochrome/photolyase family protein n=1 Tax=Paludibacterium yongneupense TaxID=400061 RepID=UPI000409C050|nr:deoxyribodipyrimidine photo-lyase [Paludibacterium yongneupense]